MSGTTAESVSPDAADPKPVLDQATRSFVRRTIAAGLVEIDDLKKVVVSLMAEDDRFSPQRLADGLVGAGILTKWQANKLLLGRSKGFYLGSYRLLRPIGKGGMGMVYLGEHHVMKRLMALKILPPEATDSPRRLERFKEEARACAQLDHPNIVRAYDFAEAGGRYYIVMEFVDGIDLHHAVNRDGVMSSADVIDLLRQATSGLEHAHARGIVHRDIKPANLLLRTDGVLKVSDLGLARVGLAELTSEAHRRLMGTADFVAPEQAINSQQVDASADIYSLGCTAFYLLTGQPPFPASSVKQRLARHQTAEVPDVRSLREDCPESLARLIQRMMAKRPNDRPKSTTELLGQLNRLGAGSHGKPNAGKHPIRPASDTDLDDVVYQATLEDTSLSSGGEINLAVELADGESDVGGFGELDFGDLPSVVPQADQPHDPSNAMPYRGGVKAKQAAAAKPSSSSKPTGEQASGQLLLLGVGLTLAVLSLIAVLAIGAHSLSKPLPGPTPSIKKTENSDGQSVLIINR